MLGGRPFPAITTFEVTELIDAGGCVVLEMVTKPDPEQMTTIIEETIVLAFPDLVGDELISFSETFFLQNRITARYNFGTGFFHEIVAEQTITIESETRRDTTTLTDVTP